MLDVDLQNWLVLAAAALIFLIGFLVDWFREDEKPPQPRHHAAGDVAARVQAVISEHLGTTFDSVSPGHELQGDLGVKFDFYPDLFWALEEEFDITTDWETLEMFEQTTAKLVTFADLVKYVEAKIAEESRSHSSNSASTT